MAEADSTLAVCSGRETDDAASFTVDRRGDHSACVRWSIPQFSKLTQKSTRCLWSKYFDVGGYDCRVLVYPAGDSQAVRGYVSIYVQVTDPKNAPKWDCFASHKLSVVHQTDESKSICRDSWHRFSAKKKSHGWCEFAPVTTIVDPRQGLAVNDTVLVTAEVSVLSETVNFSRDADLSPTSVLSVGSDVMNGKFTWKVHNFGLFQDMIKSQKVMSPAFPAGDCNLRLSIYQSAVSGTNYLSMCLESKDPDKAGSSDHSCWCLFRMSVLSQTQGSGSGKHLHRDSFGRFAADIKTGDNTSLGWNDFMTMASFTDPVTGHLLDDSATFSATFYVIKESSTFSRMLNGSGAVTPRPRSKHKSGSNADVFQGKFTWKIEHFTRLKELLKKRKITGMCVKSKRFQVAGRDCRLIIYPRGQSQPPNHLSMFLEVTESAAASWSYFVSHRLSVINQTDDAKSVTKESQNRYSKQAKDWGWREFLTLTSLFDQDAGFLVNDSVVFAAEVLVLKESYKTQEAPEQSMAVVSVPAAAHTPPLLAITWHIDNFSAFKDILETRKLFSKYFTVEKTELRIGVYESSNTLCMYLESDASGSTLENNLWVKFRIAVINQRNPEKSEWKESAICTKTWNNSVLQFSKASDLVGDGFISKDSVSLSCEVLECCPWFEFADLDLGASDAEFDTSSSVSYEIAESEADSETGIEEAFCGLLGRAGVSLRAGQGAGALQPGVDLEELESMLRERLLVDAGAVASFAAGLRTFLDDPHKLRRLLMPTMGPKSTEGPCLLDLLAGIPALQQPLLVLVLETLILCCQHASDSHFHAQPAPQSAHQRKPAPASASQQPAADLTVLSRHEPTECASSTSPADQGPARIPAAFPRSSRHRDADVPVRPAHESSHRASGKGTSRQMGLDPGHGAAAGRHGPNGTLQAARADDLLQLGMHWLRTLPHGICQNSNGKAGQASGGLQAPLAQKLLMLAAVVPRRLQTDAVLLIPHLLLLESEQARSADALLHCLRANVWGDVCQELRVPVFSALNIMDLPAASAGDVADMLLEVLPALGDMELPQALVLGTKVHDSAVPGWPARFAGALRSRVHASIGQPAGSAALDSVRLGLVMDKAGTLAAAVMASIDGEWRASKPAAAPGEARETSAAAPAADVEFLLDALSRPATAREACKLFSRGVVNGWINQHHVLAALSRRRMHLAPATGSALHGSHNSHTAASAPLPTDVASIPILAASSASSPTAATINDFDAVLSLAEEMAGGSAPAVRSMAISLYRILLRCFDDLRSREAVLRTLVNRACSSGDAGASDAASSTDRAHAVPPRGLHGAGTLLDVLQPLPDCYGPALLLMASNAQSALQQADVAASQTLATKAAKERALQEQQAAAQRARSEATAIQRTLDDTQATLAEAQATHRSSLASANAGRKDLQEKLGNVERELEWVRAELDEERTAAARKGKEASGKAKEADAALSRLRNLHREELKKLQRDKQQLAERVQELEAAQTRSTGALASARSSAAAAVQQQESATKQADERISSAHSELQSLQKQVEQQRARADESAAAAQAVTVRAETAEQALRQERARVAPLYGANLDALSPADLAALAGVHEDGLRRIKALQTPRAPEQEEDDDNNEFTGSLPGAVDLSFMNGHDTRHEPAKTPLSRASVTSSAESLASISSAPIANGLAPHSYAAVRSHPHHHHSLSLGNGPGHDFSGFGPAVSMGHGLNAMPRGHSLQQEHSRSAFTAVSAGQPPRAGSGTINMPAGDYSGGLMGQRSLAGGNPPRHPGGISQALGIAASAPFVGMGMDGAQPSLRSGHAQARPQPSVISDAQHARLAQQHQQQQQQQQLASMHQKATSRGHSGSGTPMQHAQAGRGMQRGANAPAGSVGDNRARSPAMGPYFAANGHSMAFAQGDPPLSGAFPSLLNGLGRQGNAARRDGSTHPLW